MFFGRLNLLALKTGVYENNAAVVIRSRLFFFLICRNT
jgi:hypothetical protein